MNKHALLNSALLAVFYPGLGKDWLERKKNSFFGAEYSSEITGRCKAIFESRVMCLTMKM